MTDQQRARALAEALLGPVGLTPDVLAALEQSFERVRADERRGIVEELTDLRNLIADAHDALGELMGSPFVAIDWPQLAGYLGNNSWVGLKQRIDAAIAKATETPS